MPDLTSEISFAGSADGTPSSDPPRYAKWGENINNLLEDGEGFYLFKEYLQEENLERYINFWLVFPLIPYSH